LVFSNNALPTSLSCGSFLNLKLKKLNFKYPLTQLLGAPRSSTPARCMTMGPRPLLNKILLQFAARLFLVGDDFGVSPLLSQNVGESSLCGSFIWCVGRETRPHLTPENRLGGMGIPSCVCAGRCLCFECLFSETNIGTCACCVGLFVSCPMFLKHGKV
jgi:hypothetical protein